MDPWGLCPGNGSGIDVTELLNQLEDWSNVMMANPMADGMPMVPIDQGLGIIGMGVVKGARGVTILGSRANTLKYIGKRGYNILNIKNWTPLKNIKWLDKAIQRMDKFKIVTNPLKHQELMKKLNKPSAFTDLELPHLLEEGFIKKGSKMVRP